MPTVPKDNNAPARRNWGDGTLETAPDGRLVARVTLGRAGGKRQRVRVYARTKHELNQKIAKLRLDDENGTLRQARDKTNFGQFLDRWLATLRPRPQGNYSPTTIAGYKALATLRLKPLLGGYRLAEIGPDEVQLLQDRILDQGRASQTALNARNLLSKVLHVAMRQRLITSNPVDMVDPPPASRGRSETLEGAAAGRLLGAIAGHRLEAGFLLEFALGLRRSEILGLTWSDIDLTTRPGTLRVRQSLHRVKGGGIVITEPKSLKGRRTLALPPRVAAALHARRQSQLDDQIGAAETWQNKTRNLVFTTLHGTPYEPSHFTQGIKAMLRQAGAGHLRGHDLRHAVSSTLQTRGLSPLGTMGVLGHASPDMTLGVYGHLLDAERRRAAEIMEAYMDELGTAQEGS